MFPIGLHEIVARFEVNFAKISAFIDVYFQWKTKKKHSSKREQFIYAMSELIPQMTFDPTDSYAELLKQRMRLLEGTFLEPNKWLNFTKIK